MLIERRYVFHNRLIKIVKGYHTVLEFSPKIIILILILSFVPLQKFLAGYNPLLQVPEDKVTRWHQNFDVDGVPDIPLANLPTPPDVKTFATAKDVLGNNSVIIHLIERNEVKCLIVFQNKRTI